MGEDVLVRQKGGNMKKRIFFIGVVFLILIGIGLSNTVEENYSNALKAIDKWLTSLDKNTFVEATSQELFNWKLKIESAEDIAEKFLAFVDIYKEIGDKEFVYDDWIYNRNSLMYRKIVNYGNYAYYKKTFYKGSPSIFLRETYDYYKNNIVSKEEQYEWLHAYMTFLDFSGWRTNKDVFIKKLTTDSYPIVEDILKQYMILTKYFLENNTEVILNVGYYYSQTGIMWSSKSETESALEELTKVVKGWAEYFKPDIKNNILSFIMDEFPETDQAVQIYAALNE